jgi:hypothetical protein
MLIVAVMVYPMAVPNKLEYCTSPQMNTCLGPAPDTIVHKPYEAKFSKKTQLLDIQQAFVHKVSLLNIWFQEQWDHSKTGASAAFCHLTSSWQ